MVILVAILIIAVIAAVAFAVMQRRRQPGAARIDRRAESPIGRPSRRAARSDPMAEVVADHAQATDPQEVVAAEQRMRAQARQVAAGLHANANANGAGSAPAYGAAGNPAYGGTGPDNGAADPAYGATDPAYGADPAYADPNDPAYRAAEPAYGAPAAADPGDEDLVYEEQRLNGEVPARETLPANYDDHRFDGRRAENYVDPRSDDAGR